MKSQEEKEKEIEEKRHATVFVVQLKGGQTCHEEEQEKSGGCACCASCSHISLPSMLSCAPSPPGWLTGLLESGPARLARKAFAMSEQTLFPDPPALFLKLRLTPRPSFAGTASVLFLSLTLQHKQQGHAPGWAETVAKKNQHATGAWDDNPAQTGQTGLAGFPGYVCGCQIEYWRKIGLVHSVVHPAAG